MDTASHMTLGSSGSLGAHLVLHSADPLARGQATVARFSGVVGYRPSTRLLHRAPKPPKHAHRHDGRPARIASSPMTISMLA